jgi:hypothetical protein
VTISEVTRRAVFEFFELNKVAWSGRLNDDEFLARLYDLTKIRSDDRRFPNAAADIHQHTVNNSDWGAHWVFYDHRFNLLHGSDNDFVRFVAETVHPVVRADPDEARQIVKALNPFLAADGWRLVEVRSVSGRPVFEAQLADRLIVFDEPTGWTKVDRQLQAVREQLDSASTEEQYQTVGLLCREVLISVSQEMFDPAVHLPIDDKQASDTDARRKLEQIFEVELHGSASEEARAHAKAAVRLALALQHKRTADFRTAALCAEGTTSVVNMLAILAERRGRTSSA